jgi:hypothetical protein
MSMNSLAEQLAELQQLPVVVRQIERHRLLLLGVARLGIEAGSWCS